MSAATPSRLEELLQGVVFRLAKPTDTFPPDSIKPHIGHFVLSSDDERDAVRTGIPLLSVWDQQRTSVANAKAIMGAPWKDGLAFALRGDKVRALVVPNSECKLKVFRDPLPSNLQGADGHCGIAGLDDASCPSKNERKALRTQLVDLALRLDEN
jgi:hypothetical protein